MMRPHRPQPSRPDQAGVSIIEILISLALGSVLALGVIQIFASSQASNDIIMGEARLTENSRYAVDAMARTLRLTGLRTTPEELPALRFDSTDPAVAASDGTAVADDAPARSVSVTAGGTNTTLDAVKANTDTITVQYQGLDDGSVTNCLGQTVAADNVAVDTFFVGEGATAAAATSAAGQAEASRWSLYCAASIVDAGGTVASSQILPIASEVMNLQVELGEDTDGDGVPQRYAAPSTAGLNPEDVIGVRVTLTMYGARPLSLIDRLGEATTVVETNLQRQFVRTIGLRNLLS